jgi:phosphate transport system protein
VTAVTRESYQRSLNELRTDVRSMGDLVVERLEMGLESLSTRDERLARDVVEGDEEINETYLALEDRCIDLFALQQPVAGDLRFVTASFKIITDLERVGDLAANLGQYALAADHDVGRGVAVDEIGNDARDLLVRSLDAYETGDVDACWDIASRDDAIDTHCLQASETVARDLIERAADGGDPWTTEQVLDDVTRVLLTIRDLERVGDHAVNIAARTLYMVENDPSLVY